MERLSENSPYYDFEAYLEQVSDPGASEARRIILKDRCAIKNMIHLNQITKYQLDEFAEDYKLQARFDSIMKLKENGGEDAKKALQEVEDLKQNIYAGYMIFRGKYYENFYKDNYGISLISPFED
jgi:hypothetical protein